MQLISLKVETETLKRADHVLKLLKKHPIFSGISLTRSAVLRQALEAGLEYMEQRYGEDLAELGLDGENPEDPPTKKPKKKKGFFGL